MTGGLRALAEKATPGPWRWLMDSGDVMLWGDGDPAADGHVLTPHVCKACRERGAPCLGPTEADAAFIVAAVNSLPALLTAVEAAQALKDHIDSKGLDGSNASVVYGNFDAALDALR